MISPIDMVENIVGKGENAGYQHFLLFPQIPLCVQKPFYPGLLKVGIVYQKVISSNGSTHSIITIVFINLSISIEYNENAVYTQSC